MKDGIHIKKQAKFLIALTIILILVIVTVGYSFQKSSSKNTEIRLHVLCMNMSDNIVNVVLRISIDNDGTIYNAITNVSQGTVEIYNRPASDRTGYVINATIDNLWMGEVLTFPCGTNMVEILINANGEPQISVASA